MVLDPFGLVPGLPGLVWDPIAGCVDPIVAERRAEAFTAGTIKGAVAEGYGDQLWAPPPAEMLEAETDLSAGQRAWLADRLLAHPWLTRA